MTISSHLTAILAALAPVAAATGGRAIIAHDPADPRQMTWEQLLEAVQLFSQIFVVCAQLRVGTLRVGRIEGR